MIPQSRPQLSSAFRLGRLIEELASINRKKIALSLLNKEESTIQDERIISKSSDEIEFNEDSIGTLLERMHQLLPQQFTDLIQKIEKAERSGLGNMDLQQQSLLHAAIAGLFEEGMARGTTWHCVQAGRLSQRSCLLMHTIVDGMDDEQMPNNALLKYLTIRADSPFSDFEGGTHLWVIHQVFNHLLKVPKNPKSAESTLTRLGLHIESFPIPESLKKDHDKVRMSLNRMSNDLSFVNIHDMIGDDPEDHFSRIISFFKRQQIEIDNLISLIRSYLIVFESYIDELSEDEIFEFHP